MKVSGKLSEKEVKHVLNAKRGTTIGPTTIYYAGVTAPIISAGMAIFSKTALESAGLALPWAYLASSIIAAFAGISWYLIFMRWASRERLGRDGETELATQVELTELGLIMRRGAVETHIAEGAVAGIEELKRHVHVTIIGGPDIILPHHWFAGEDARAAFVEAVETLAGRGNGD